MKKRIIAMLLSIYLLISCTSCTKNSSKTINDYGTSIEQLDEDEKALAREFEDFIYSRNNYLNNKTAENRIDLVQNGKNLVDLAMNLLELELSVDDVTYNCKNLGSEESQIYLTVNNNDQISKFPSEIRNLILLCRSIDSYKGDGSNGDAWTEEVMKEYINTCDKLVEIMLKLATKTFKCIINFSSDNKFYDIDKIILSKEK